jgi:hypothetical protein
MEIIREVLVHQILGFAFPLLASLFVKLSPVGIDGELSTRLNLLPDDRSFC